VVSHDRQQGVGTSGKDEVQHRDGLTLTVEAALPALNAHLGVLKKVFQVRAGHQAAYPPTSPLWRLFCP
jgi:hypothetical protein